MVEPVRDAVRRCLVLAPLTGGWIAAMACFRVYLGGRAFGDAFVAFLGFLAAPLLFRRVVVVRADQLEVGYVPTCARGASRFQPESGACIRRADITAWLVDCAGRFCEFRVHTRAGSSVLFRLQGGQSARLAEEEFAHWVSAAD